MRVAIAAVLAVALLPLLACQQRPLTLTFSSVVVTGDRPEIVQAALEQQLEEAGAVKSDKGVKLECSAKYVLDSDAEPRGLTLIVHGSDGHDAVATVQFQYRQSFVTYALSAADQIADSFRRQEAVRLHQD